tara:strand:+ start:2139 stop:2360 length:222 start_codon:yes stop_codon:yes gene_type:complete
MYAEFAFVYILSGVCYLLLTRSIGTPFKDALQNYPELLKIKEDSVHERKIIFLFSIGVSIIILAFTKPFIKCP